MVNKTTFTGCCTAEILHRFPYDYESNRHFKVAFQDVKSKLKHSRNGGFATCVVTLTSRQLRSVEGLKDLGFVCSDPIVKDKRHPESKLYVLYIDLYKWAMEQKKLNARPRDAQGRFISNNVFKV